MFFCYILECSDGSLYVGCTDDLEQRLRYHNDGRASDWTAARRPVKYVWNEQHPTVSSARKRENQIKRWTREKKLAPVRASNFSQSEKLSGAESKGSIIAKRKSVLSECAAAHESKGKIQFTNPHGTIRDGISIKRVRFSGRSRYLQEVHL